MSLQAFSVFHDMNDLAEAIASLPPEERLKLKSK